MSKNVNVPTPEGRQLGAQLARLADKSEAEMLAEQGMAPVRCKSCAFRLGTFPNGCPTTVMDALKCVMEAVPFYCHCSPRNQQGFHSGLCAGYIVASSSLARGTAPAIETFWPFSHEDATP